MYKIVHKAFIEAEIKCPQCGTKQKLSTPDFEHAISAGLEFNCFACRKTFELFIMVPDRAAELPLEPSSGDGAFCNCKQPWFLEYEDGEYCKVCGKTAPS